VVRAQICRLLRDWALPPSDSTAGVGARQIVRDSLGSHTNR
jgi:hypothetical protein